MPLMLAAAAMFAFVATGCDDRVQITRDPDVKIRTGASWAWTPDPQVVASRDNRRVLSRDNVGREQQPRDMVREDNPNNQIVQDKVRQAIQQSLMSKGLMQSSDPATADFLVDYHFAVDRRSETVQTVYPGAYPGLVCGPYGCYRGWGYGPAAVGYERVHWRAGTIAFNFTQNPSKRLVYQAIGEKPVRRDTFSLTQDEINGLVNHLLKDLKTKK
ncbi:MAG TPA: DUF4136 domain-containing protein [Candidatus Acidoferrum sp.]|jgi:hypothetical protein|nr:DUF4136 domain-containing protein [Candidatus Acidoferrum sp.]